MEQEHRKAIQANFISLVEQTDLDTMVSALYEKGVFSEQMIEPYKDSSVDERTRKRSLYMDVMRRGPHAFDLLLEALSEAGYWNLVRYLDPNSSLHSHGPPRSSKPLPKSESSDNAFVSISGSKMNQIDIQNKNSMSSSSAAAHSGASSSTHDTTPSGPVEIDHYKVVKSTRFFEDNNKDFKLYPTGGRNRGVLVVFSYSKFRNDVGLNRRGVDVDSERLKRLFKEIGFRVLCYTNLNVAETKETLKSFKDVLKGAECVFIVVSSHGYERDGTSDTDVRCSDGLLLPISTIIEYFNNRNLPALRDKPKVFIFQLCRGSQDDWIDPSSSLAQRDGGEASGVTTRHENGVTTRHENGINTRHENGVVTDGISPLHDVSKDVDDVSRQNRLYSDILIAHSTLPGFVSHRTPDAGTWYIQTLCKVFSARAHDCHVEELFTLVDKELQLTFHWQTSSVDKWGFNRRLYLYPGLVNAPSE